MSLYKKEQICLDCDTQYILVVKPEDLDNIAFCPFCASPIEYEEADLNEEE